MRYFCFILFALYFLTAHAVPQSTSDAKSQFRMSAKYFTGSDGPKNFPEGIRWLQLSANNGYDEAQYLLGFAYETGNFGVQQNPAQAVFWYQKAAEQNNFKALTALGEAYYKGIGVAQNKALGVEWLERAVANTPAQLQLPPGTYTVPAVDLHIIKQFPIWEAEAAKGNPQAQAQLGRAYYYGKICCEKDIDKGLFWLRKAAASGDQAAKDFISKVDTSNAVIASAEKNDPKVQYQLGMLYLNGNGVQQNDDKAINLISLSANQGYSDAEYQMGKFYAFKDNQKAMDWYLKAAMQDHVLAQFKLGSLYSDHIKSYVWFSLAATNKKQPLPSILLEITNNRLQALKNKMTPEELNIAETLVASDQRMIR